MNAVPLEVRERDGHRYLIVGRGLGTYEVVAWLGRCVHVVSWAHGDLARSRVVATDAVREAERLVEVASRSGASGRALDLLAEHTYVSVELRALALGLHEQGEAQPTKKRPRKPKTRRSQ